ncbi:MAG: helix-turn-helix domain-containing protein [Deltaproteobacteria bacterium]|jgi:transcriptional regulator with XRE-family HTH domain|nr:helix-turn-helix domain-containing protein [Deltaproteobacteria bacterium]
MFDPKPLGRRIRALRMLRGLSQDKLAELAGLNGKFIGEVERGNANISVANLAKLATVLETPLPSLLILDHERDRNRLVEELHKLIDTADDRQLAVIYRVVEAVIR